MFQKVWTSRTPPQVWDYMNLGEGKVEIIYFYFYEIYSFLNSEEIKNIVRYREKKEVRISSG
jgi:hypothetical protein